MLACTRLLRLCLITSTIGLAAVYGLRPVASAWAQDDDDEGDDEGGDDDKADKGGDDEGGGGGGDDEEEDEEEEEEDQPAVTAGGNYTKATYPQAELERPLTITKGLSEFRAGLGVDISSKTAFDSAGLLADGRYGIEDNLEAQVGFKGIYNFRQIDFYAGVEGSFVYDLLDFRLAARLSSCSPENDADLSCGKNAMGMGESSFAAHLDVGFPFRYAPKPQVGIIALDTLVTIDTDSDPDLNPSLGIVVQPLPMIAAIAKAQILFANFDVDVDKLVVPATLAVQVTPNNTIDLGLEFTLQNVKADETAGGPFGQRFLVLYGQMRL